MGTSTPLRQRVYTCPYYLKTAGYLPLNLLLEIDICDFCGHFVIA
jgi:hypothetical protein